MRRDGSRVRGARTAVACAALVAVLPRVWFLNRGLGQDELFTAVPLTLSSVRKIGEMPAPVEQPTPAQAELEGGLLEGTTPLPGPASADA